MTFARGLVVAIACAAAVTGCHSTSAPADSGVAPDAGCLGRTGCFGPCEVGNSFGVGRYCTKGGGECGGTPNQLAPYCSADFTARPTGICTRPCEDMSECGEDAVCISGNEDNTGPKGCVLAACVRGPSTDDSDGDASLDGSGADGSSAEASSADAASADAPDAADGAVSD
jgi:hypothetical protein